MSYSGKKWRLKLCDILGNVVAEKVITNVSSSGIYSWNLSSYSSGAYMLMLQSDDEKPVRKIIRQ